MRKLIASASLVFALVACVDPKVVQQRVDEADHKTCVSYGFSLGTSGYAQCRMIVAQNRSAEDAAHSAAMLGAAGQMLQLSQPRTLTPTYRMQTTCFRQGAWVTCN